jgi:hypothetical protein
VGNQVGCCDENIQRTGSGRESGDAATVGVGGRACARSADRWVARPARSAGCAVDLPPNALATRRRLHSDVVWSFERSRTSRASSTMRRCGKRCRRCCGRADRRSRSPGYWREVFPTQRCEKTCQVSAPIVVVYICPKNHKNSLIWTSK